MLAAGRKSTFWGATKDKKFKIGIDSTELLNLTKRDGTQLALQGLNLSHVKYGILRDFVQFLMLKKAQIN